MVGSEARSILDPRWTSRESPCMGYSPERYYAEASVRNPLPFTHAARAVEWIGRVILSGQSYQTI